MGGAGEGGSDATNNIKRNVPDHTRQLCTCTEVEITYSATIQWNFIILKDPRWMPLGGQTDWMRQEMQIPFRCSSHQKHRM